MDIVQKIREELARLKEETSIGLSEHENGVEQGRLEIINVLSNFLDSLQKESVSGVWHYMSEDAENGRNIIIIDTKDFYGAVLRKGGSQLRNHNKERYVKWAYIDDIINLSNIERIVKNCKEPASDDLEEAVENYASTGEVLSNGKVMIDFQAEKAFRAGAKWQKEQMMAKAVEGGYFSYKNGHKHISCDIDEKLTDIKFGDKIKVIVIKED